jgi:hypothetical protein
LALSYLSMVGGEALSRNRKRVIYAPFFDGGSAMPARKALVPKYCLHKPSGRAYCRTRGRVVYCGQYGTEESKAEYGRLVAELAVSPVPVSTRDLTLVELCAVHGR